MRLQLNAHIQPIGDITQTEGLREIILPIMYFDSGAHINSDKVKLMKEKILNPLALVHGLEYGAVCVGGVLVLIILIYFICTSFRKGKMNNMSVIANSTEEQTPLLR